MRDNSHSYSKRTSNSTEVNKSFPKRVVKSPTHEVAEVSGHTGISESCILKKHVKGSLNLMKDGDIRPTSIQPVSCLNSTKIKCPSAARVHQKH